MRTRNNVVAHKAAWRERTRAWAVAELGGRCAKCGTDEQLQFDHIIAKTKSFVISEAIANCYSRARITEELKKCQLLCIPCHKQKAIDLKEHVGGHNRVINPRHGTQVRYAPPYLCRCRDCRLWKKLYRAKLVDARGNAIEAHADGRGHGRAEAESSNLSDSSTERRPAMADALNRQEGQWAPTVKERFGIADPREIKKQVDEIVDTKLPTDACEDHHTPTRDLGA